MTQDIKRTLFDRLAAWASACVDAGCFTQAFVFGSLVNEDGYQFMPDESDLDLLVVIPSPTPMSRLTAFDRMLPMNGALERDLASVLEREDRAASITSIVAVSPLELRLNIHKGGRPALFTNSPFIPLVGTDTPTIFPRASALSAEKLAYGTFASEQAQGYRNTFLAVSPNGSRKARQWDDDRRAVPKEMMRAAAQLRYFVERLADFSGTDVNKGLDFLYDRALERRADDPAHEQLCRWFEVRRGGAGVRSALSPENAVLLWETLSTFAERVLEQREGEVGDGGGAGPVTGPPPDPSRDDLVSGIDRPHSLRLMAFIHEYARARFATRDAELHSLDAWLSGSPSSTALLVAEAGRGKSALLIHWLTQLKTRSTHDIVFMPVSLRFDTARVTAVARSIAPRLSRLRGAERSLSQSDEPFLALEECREILRSRWSGTKPLLVVVDGLDEAIGWNGTDLLPEVPGQRIKVLIAARGHASRALEWEAKLGWRNAQLIELGALSRTAVEDLVTAIDASFVHVDAHLWDDFHEMTGGDPLIVQLCVAALGERSGTAAERLAALVGETRPGQEPLKRFFDRWWEEQRAQWHTLGVNPSDRVQEAMNLLACALGPLRLADLCSLTGWDGEDVRATLDHLKRFVISDEHGRFVLSHSRLRDYFTDRLKEADTHNQWRQKYVAYGLQRLTDLDSQRVLEGDTFRRRFEYVLRHLSLHFADDAPVRLATLVSRTWLSAWRALDGDDGLYGGFCDDVMRAEVWARNDRMRPDHSRALLVKASITSLSSNIPPWLMRRLVETRHWPLSRALKLIERFVDDNERAQALGVLAGAVDGAEQAEVVERATALQPAARTRALAWMFADLVGANKRTAFSTILDAGTLFHQSAFVSLDRFSSSLSSEFAQQLLHAAELIDNGEARLRAVLAVISDADALPAEERASALSRCEEDVLGFERASQRAYYRCSIAEVALRVAPAERLRLLRAAWEEIRLVPPDSDEGVSLLAEFADDIVDADAAMRTDVIEAMRTTLGNASMPWLRLGQLGPRLARLGFVEEVLDASERTTLDEYSRGMLLGSLLPFASHSRARILTSLRAFKRREWALEPLAYQLKSLTKDERSALVRDAIAWVSAHPDRSDLLGKIAQKLELGDPESAHILAAARAVPDKTSKAHRLVDCAHLVSDLERGPFVLEILRDANEIEHRERKRRLLGLLSRMIGADQPTLSAALQVARHIGDEGLIATVVDHVAVSLAKAGYGQEATALIDRAATVFSAHPTWSLFMRVHLLAVLPSHLVDAVWHDGMSALAAIASDRYRHPLLRAQLTCFAPSSQRGVEVAGVLDEIGGLDNLFDKALASISLLRALEGDARQTRVDQVVDLVVDGGGSLREQFLLLRELFSELTPAEYLQFKPRLLPVIDRVLRRKPREETSELVPIDEAFYVEGLAEFLDLDLVRGEVARCSPEAVSTLQILGVRLAKLGAAPEGLAAVRRIESPEERAVGLARVVGDVSEPERNAVLDEIREELNGVGDQSSGEAESYLIEYLPASDREAAIERALKRALAGSSERRRRSVLAKIGEMAAQHLSMNALGELWLEVISSAQRREDVVRDLDALLPVASHLGGSALLSMLGTTMMDVAEWFP